MKLTETQRRLNEESGQERGRSNAEVTMSELTSMIAKLVLLSTAANRYGYSDMEYALDAACNDLAAAQRELIRLSELTPEQRAYMYPDNEARTS